MTITVFLILLSAFSAVSSLVTEGVKNLFAGSASISYNVVALVSALIIGTGGTAVYYQFYALPFTVSHILYMVLMGLASGLVSMTSYDKVKQTIMQLIRCQQTEGGRHV